MKIKNQLYSIYIFLLVLIFVKGLVQNNNFRLKEKENFNSTKTNATISKNKVNRSLSQFLSKPIHKSDLENGKTDKTSKIYKNLKLKTEYIMGIIINHTRLIHGKICENNSKILDIFLKVDKEIMKIIKSISFTSKSKLSKIDKQYKITEAINNTNLIKALLVKMSNVVLALKNVKCKNFQNILRQKLMIETKLIKLVEKIQKSISKKYLNINLVILT